MPPKLWGPGQSPGASFIQHREDNAMARPPTGPALIDPLDGSPYAKERARLVLETIAGTRSLDDAASALQISASRFHVLRQELLSVMIAGAEPKPVGRPPKPPPVCDTAATDRQATLDRKVEQELDRLRLEVETVLGPRLKAHRNGSAKGGRKHQRP